MTRIRYVFNDQSLFVSKPMVAGHDVVVVSLNPVTKTYSVASAHTGQVIAQSKEFTDMATVKSAAKECLKLLGVVFEDEVRKKLV